MTGASYVIAYAVVGVVAVFALVLAGAAFGVGFRLAMEARRGSTRRALVPRTHWLDRSRRGRRSDSGVPLPEDYAQTLAGSLRPPGGVAGL